MSGKLIENISLIADVERDVVKKEILRVLVTCMVTALVVLIAYFASAKLALLTTTLSVPVLLLILLRTRALRQYLSFTAALSREELYSSIAILVLSLLGSWTYVSRVLSDIFPATSRFVRLHLEHGPKLLQEIRHIVDTVVYKDGTLPYVARERVLHTLRNAVESLGVLVQSIMTCLAMLYMFYVIVNFLSFMRFGSTALSSHNLLLITLILTLVFALAISSRSPVHDYALEELKSKAPFVLVPSLLSFLVAHAFLHDMSMCVMIFVVTFCVVGIAVLRRSARIDRLDHAVIWDRVLNMRMLRGAPVDQALRSILGEDLYQQYVKTYPFSAIRNLVKHLEEVGNLDVMGLFRQLLIELFEATKRMSRTVYMNVLVLFGFALAMLLMQTWLADLLYPALVTLQKTQMFSAAAASAGVTIPVVLRPEDIVTALEMCSSSVPPVVTFAVFLIARAASSTTKALRITLLVALSMLAAQIYVKYIFLPKLTALATGS